MNKKVMFRTAQKIGVLILTIAGVLLAVLMSGWIGQYLFNDSLIGNSLLFGTVIVASIIYYAYRDAKYEVENENQKLIRELSKNG